MARRNQITALLIAPDRGLAETFRSSVARTRVFEIVGDLTSYPSAQNLESKLRQLQPEVVLIDVATDLEMAGGLIRHATSQRPPVHVIGLHTRNESQAILKSLRDGASEFLYAPFEVSIQEAAVQRIQKLLAPAAGESRERGRVVVFTSTKPGSGASTLALQTAYAIRRACGGKVLLADLDLQGSSLEFFLDVDHDRSILDLLMAQGRITPELWDEVAVDAKGVDLIPGPALPFTDPLNTGRLLELLDYARSNYDWTVLDLPSVFHRMTLECVSGCDRAFLISTPELASLHLTRRAVKLLNQLAFDSTKYQVLVNRLEARTELSSSDLSKLFECQVDKGLPNERLTLERVLTLGQPLDGGSELGKAIEGLATKLLGALPEERKLGPMLRPRPAFSEI